MRCPGGPASPMPAPPAGRHPRKRSEAPIHRLVLWNIDLTLVDVAQVTREASAEAFATVTRYRLIHPPPMAGRTDSEAFFEALAVNAPELTDTDATQRLLARYVDELAKAFDARRGLLVERGRVLPGAREALAALARQPGLVQTVLTGTIKPNAVRKLRAFGLDEFIDFGIGGYGSEVYPKGTLLLVARSRAGEKHGVTFGEGTSVYIGDSSRDMEAARVGGARSIGVASGRATVAELTAAGADAVLADLSDTRAIMRTVGDLTIPVAS